MAGPRYLGSDRQRDREHEHARRVVLVDVLAHGDALCSLGADTQQWHAQGMEAVRVDSRVAAGVHTRDSQLENIIVRRIGRKQLPELDYIWVARDDSISRSS